MNRRLSLRTKLLMGFGTVTLLVIVMASIIFVSSNRLESSIVSLTDNKFPLATEVQVLNGQLNHALSALRGQIILGNDPAERQRFIEQQRK